MTVTELYANAHASADDIAVRIAALPFATASSAGLPAKSLQLTFPLHDYDGKGNESVAVWKVGDRSTPREPVRIPPIWRRLRKPLSSCSQEAHVRGV